MAAGLRVLWAAADEVYGRCGEFRAALRALGLAYVVIIPCDYRVTLAKNKVTRADQAIHEAVFERRSCGNGDERPALRGLGAARHRGPAGVPADPPPAGPGEEPVHVLPVLRAGRPARDHDLFHHHRRPQMASRNNFQDREGRLRLGPVPGPDLGRALPAHRPDRPRPARTAAIQAALAGRRVLPAAAPARQKPRLPSASRRPAPLTCRSTPETRRCPPRAGQPCPPGIPPIALSAAETARIDAPRPRLESRPDQPRPPRLPSPLVSMAAAPPGPRPLAPLQHPPGSPRHLSHADRKEVTICNRTPEPSATLSCSAVTDRKTATVIPGGARCQCRLCRPSRAAR